MLSVYMDSTFFNTLKGMNFWNGKTEFWIWSKWSILKADTKTVKTVVEVTESIVIKRSDVY